MYIYSMFIYILVFVSWFQLPQHGGHRFCGWEHGGIELNWKSRWLNIEDKLVVWNMCLGNDNPNWLFFSEGWNHRREDYGLSKCQMVFWVCDELIINTMMHFLSNNMILWVHQCAIPHRFIVVCFGGGEVMIIKIWANATHVGYSNGFKWANVGMGSRLVGPWLLQMFFAVSPLQLGHWLGQCPEMTWPVDALWHHWAPFRSSYFVAGSKPNCSIQTWRTVTGEYWANDCDNFMIIPFLEVKMGKSNFIHL